MSGARALKIGGLFLFLGIATAGFVMNRSRQSLLSVSPASFTTSPITKEKLAEVLSDSAAFYRFPNEIDVPLANGTKIHSVVQYAFDPKLQETMENLLKTYGPDYGAFVALDAKSGRVLSMVSYSKKEPQVENLALRATFPSASVFKMVTAAAVIEQRKFSASTIIPFNGANHTLFRTNILHTGITRWTHYITLKDAFAKSVNTVFGRIGAYNVGHDELSNYADRFGFNRKIAADFNMHEGRAPIPNDAWGLAETASGYTRDNTMSPMQGALMAATVINDGIMMEPYLVQSVFTSDGTPVYTAEPRVAKLALDTKTAAEIRNLMKETVVHGTSRRSFHGFFRKDFSELNVGGKTGSLTGMDPPGKYDWFVGYAQNGKEKIAVAALTIHQKLWRVKSSYLARKAIETYFQGKLQDEEVALSDRSP